MRSWIRELSLLAIISSSVGCSLCANPFECDYVTYGSRTPRQNMHYGRVGSPFSDPALNGDGLSESVEAIDESYGEILEGANEGPIFMDEPSIEPMMIEGSP